MPVSISKRIAALAAVVAVALPVAPAAHSYYEICLVNKGAFLRNSACSSTTAAAARTIPAGKA